MSEDEAVELIGGRRLGDGAPMTWADLGCGDGTFTRALARLLPAGSVIHAMDSDPAALRHIPSEHAQVSILTHAGDFLAPPWPFNALDGVLLANSLHYVRNQMGFVRACAPAMHGPRRFLIVEYDTDRSNPWVPYPLSRRSLRRLFAGAEWSIALLGSRPSRYRRAELYSALVQENHQQ